MTKFKRVSLIASEEVFQPAKPVLLPETEDEGQVVEIRRRPHELPVGLTQEEIELLVEAIQASKYPSKARPPSLDKHERLDLLRAKLQAELR